MEKSKKNPFLIFIHAVLEFFIILTLGIGTLIVLILSKIFLSSLSVRNFLIKRFGKYNKSK